MAENKLNLNRIPYPFWLFLILLNFVLIVVVSKPHLINQETAATELPPQTAITPSPNFSATPMDEPVTNKTQAVPIVIANPAENDLFLFISFYKDHENHIYAFIPGENRYIRLFNSPYEESDPALNQDADKLAYTAKKNGYWDIYVYDFSTRQETRITDTAAYDGTPSWSPDGEFLAYSSFLDGNLNIYIQAIDDLNTPPIQLTENLSADFSPAWSPSGREIAFVSDRSGSQEIWIAQLNTVVDRFTNISNRPDFQDTNPAWIPETEQIIWSGEKEGYQQILQTNITQFPLEYYGLSLGKFAQILNEYLITVHENANQAFLSIQKIQTKQYLSFPMEIPGSVNGLQVTALSQVPSSLMEDLQNNPFLETQRSHSLQETTSPNRLARENINPLVNVNAPYPYLNEAAISAFDELRINTATLIGWDFLSDLEEAYLPLTNPAAPDLQENWSYTGRAFKYNPLTLYADLAVVVKEEHDGSTYWRTYLKARYQDGSQGKPLMQTPWNLDARYQNDPKAYEAGGYTDTIPDGYWLDFTQIAQDHHWDRLAALQHWRQYFNGALFNQFVYTDGLDWYQAMRQIYPIESIKSPTPIPSLTATPTFTATVRFFRSPSATLTPTPTPIPTRRPTWTPAP